MPRPKLRSPDQPLALQCVFGMLEFLASLKLAVVLIFAAALVLAWGTFVESELGTPAVQYGVYGTWWFTLLNVLLAASIFCAALVRFPWKRHQTGFVITHLGLLVLLFGCWLTRRGWIDAQLPVFEGAAGHIAYEDSQHFRLTISGREGEERILEIPFVSGPFNWQDYETAWFPWRWSQGGLQWQGRPRWWFPWSLARRDRGVIFDQDGIRLEVLDYYASSNLVDAPYLRLQLSMPGEVRMGPDGKPQTGPQRWVPVELKARRGPALPEHRFPPAQRQQMGGGSLVLLLAAAAAEEAAFLSSQPEGELGEQGQVVLWLGGASPVGGEPTAGKRAAKQAVEGRKAVFRVHEVLGRGAFSLADTGYSAEVRNYYAHPTLDPAAPEDRFVLADDPRRRGATPHEPAVEVLITDPQGRKGRLLLFADYPELNLPCYELGVYGSYWYDKGELTAEERRAGMGGARIDVLQGMVPPGLDPEEAAGGTELYYRYWNGKRLVFARRLPKDQTRVDAFEMPIAKLQLYVEQFVPRGQPEAVVLPQPFDKNARPVSSVRAAKVRLTVDGHSEQFWIAAPPPDPRRLPPLPLQQRLVRGNRRDVLLEMPVDQVELGFVVRLRDFEMKLDPGTSQPSHYSSYVEFLDQQGRPLRDEVVRITMNAPVDFAEPETGRSFRLFQESYIGPFQPGDPEFELYADQAEELEGRRAVRDQVYASVLTVNYDPGRGTKYVGCLLVVAGIATMFYMRAYFFKPRQPRPAQPAQRKNRPPARAAALP